MSRVLTVRESDFEVYDPGTYTARLLRIEDSEGQFGPQYRFVWQLTELEDAQFSGWCNPVLSAKSKLLAWYTAHTGVAPEIDTDVDVDVCIGKSVQLMLTIVPRQDGSGEKNKLVAVNPLARQPRRGDRRPAAPSAPPDAEPWEEETA